MTGAAIDIKQPNHFGNSCHLSFLPDFIGLWAARRAQTNEDFLIGGRNLNGWVAGFSYAATSSSAWVLMGFSGFVYAPDCPPYGCCLAFGAVM